jgi:hypothetical protein
MFSPSGLVKPNVRGETRDNMVDGGPSRAGRLNASDAGVEGTWTNRFRDLRWCIAPQHCEEVSLTGWTFEVGGARMKGFFNKRRSCPCYARVE